MTEIQKNTSEKLQEEEKIIEKVGGKKEEINPDKHKKTFKEDTIDFIKDLAIVIIIVVLIRSFLVLPFQISGQSMFDSYYDSEFIIVDVFSYLDIPLLGKFSPPKKGDVIVFRPHVNDKKEYYIKRIIASQGDTLKIMSGEVYIKKSGKNEFRLLDESFLDTVNYGKTFVGKSDKEFTYIVPNGSYFVMGDNRNGSSDSRTCFTGVCTDVGHSNFITNNDIVGKVFIDLGYFNFGTFSFTHPKYEKVDTTPKFFSGPSTFDYE